MILVIDHYDSFTYNLVQYLGELGAEIIVRRNDDLDVEFVRRLEPERIVLSPGPGRPEHSGISVEVVLQLGSSIPILGVCLGHQIIGFAFGGTVVQAPSLVHGKCSKIEHDGRTIFKDVMSPLIAGRYHSLTIAENNWPAELEVCARASEEGIIMGMRHRTWPLHGVQFHPESILTVEGKHILRNFLEL